MCESTFIKVIYRYPRSKTVQFGSSANQIRLVLIGANQSWNWRVNQSWSKRLTHLHVPGSAGSRITTKYEQFGIEVAQPSKMQSSGTLLTCQKYEIMKLLTTNNQLFWGLNWNWPTSTRPTSWIVKIDTALLLLVDVHCRSSDYTITHRILNCLWTNKNIKSHKNVVRNLSTTFSRANTTFK